MIYYFDLSLDCDETKFYLINVDGNVCFNFGKCLF